MWTDLIKPFELVSLLVQREEVREWSRARERRGSGEHLGGGWVDGTG